MEYKREAIHSQTSVIYFLDIIDQLIILLSALRIVRESFCRSILDSEVFPTETRLSSLLTCCSTVTAFENTSFPTLPTPLHLHRSTDINPSLHLLTYYSSD